MGELQKANMWKRISAGLFDLIMLGIVVCGMAFLLSFILGFEAKYDERIDHLYRIGRDELGIEDKVIDTWNSMADYEKLTDEQKTQLDELIDTYNKDPEVIQLNVLLLNMTLLMLTFGFLFGYIIMELIVPLILKNGQTFGKKLFGLAVMREDGVKATPFLMTVRTVLGKYTVEVMVPVFIIVMIFFNMTGVVGLAILVILPIVQIVLLITTRARTPIHDLFARTVVVDLASQRIFDTVEEKEAYYLRLHKEMADKADY